MHANLGYACINMTLQEKEKVQCNRGMIKRTFLSKGIEYAYKCEGFEKSNRVE